MATRAASTASLFCSRRLAVEKLIAATELVFRAILDCIDNAEALADAVFRDVTELLGIATRLSYGRLFI
jgi:hypothetical protein